MNDTPIRSKMLKQYLLKIIAKKMFENIEFSYDLTYNTKPFLPKNHFIQHGMIVKIDNFDRTQT